MGKETIVWHKMSENIVENKEWMNWRWVFTGKLSFIIFSTFVISCHPNLMWYDVIKLYTNQTESCQKHAQRRSSIFSHKRMNNCGRYDITQLLSAFTTLKKFYSLSMLQHLQHNIKPLIAFTTYNIEGEVYVSSCKWFCILIHIQGHRLHLFVDCGCFHTRKCFCSSFGQVGGIFGLKLCRILADRNYLQPGWVGPLNYSH